MVAALDPFGAQRVLPAKEMQSAMSGAPPSGSHGFPCALTGATLTEIDADSQENDARASTSAQPILQSTAHHGSTVHPVCESRT
jgi:hypothetical protein